MSKPDPYLYVLQTKHDLTYVYSQMEIKLEKFNGSEEQKEDARNKIALIKNALSVINTMEDEMIFQAGALSGIKTMNEELRFELDKLKTPKTFNLFS